MIKLDVKDYCQTCTEFEPDVESPCKSYANNRPFAAAVTDTIIKCQNREKCERLKQHLELYNLRRKSDD